MDFSVGALRAVKMTPNLLKIPLEIGEKIALQ